MRDALTDALSFLEQRVQHALRTNDRSGLEILGYGDSSVVLGCHSSVGRFACKRLPPFATPNLQAAYLEHMRLYSDALRKRGVKLLETQICFVGQAAYCVQQHIGSNAMLKYALTSKRLETLVEMIEMTITDRIGLDADITNWCVIDDELVLLDANTPLLRNAQHVSTVDYSVYFSSLPYFIRSWLSSHVQESLLKKFFSPREVMLDVLCGLIRERVGYVPYLLEKIAARFTPMITSGELRRYYLTNQSTWELFRRLQRLQRWWCKSVRKQHYPFLLPPDKAFAGHLSIRTAFSKNFGYRPQQPHD